MRLGIIGLVQFVPLFLLTLVTGWTADRVDRRWIARAVGRARAWLRARAGVRSPGRDTTTLDVALRRRRAARRRARLRRPGARRARAQPRAARDPAPRHRIVVDRLADRRDRRARRSAAISTPPRPIAPYAASALLFAVALAGLFAIGAGRAHRASTRGPTRGRRWSRGCATSATTGWCSARSASTCSRCCSAARRRCCRCSRATCSTPGPKGSAICAPRRRSARP